MTLDTMEKTSDVERLKAIFEAFTLLLAPDSRKKKCSGSSHGPFHQHLQTNLHQLDSRLTDDNFRHLVSDGTEADGEHDHQAASSSVEWQYVCRILQLLHKLSFILLRSGSSENSEQTSQKPKRPQDAPPLSKAALSISHIQTVKTALEFLACLGLCPNLSPGVGIPVQHRSKLLTSAPLDAATLAEISFSFELKRARLSACVCALAEMFTVPELQSIIVSSHLNDMLAAVLELAFSSLSTNKESLPDGQGSKGSIPKAGDETTLRMDGIKAAMPTLPQESRKLTVPVRNSGEQHTSAAACDDREVLTARQTLETMLSSVPHDLLIRELLVLQAGVPQHAQKEGRPGCSAITPPPWLKKGCGRVLLRLTKGQQGILHLYQALTAGSEVRSPSHWQQCATVAKIVIGCPVPASQVDQYVSCVSQQLLAILDAAASETGEMTQLLGAVARAMTDKYTQQFSRHFHQPLMLPLLACIAHRADRQRGDGVDSSGKEVDDVAAGEQELTLCLHKLQRVYIRSQQPHSSLVCALQPVMGVIWNLFCVTRCAVYSIRHCVRELMVTYLKVIGYTGAATCLRTLCMDEGHDGTSPGDINRTLTVHFAAGGSGGLQAVWIDTQQGSPVSDTQRVEAALDLLGDLKKEGVAGQLLVTLLKEMTDMITKESQQDDIILPASAQRSEVREQKREELTRRVNLLHLLAAICETFGAECLSDNTQILLFVKASLERGVVICRETREEEMAMFETETLSMAMGLLTAVMAGALQMKEKDRSLMEEMMPLLEVIGQGHPDEFIQEMASDLSIAIATRGAVWPSLQNKRGGETKSMHGEGRTTVPSKPDPRVKTQPSTKASPRPLIQVLSEQPASDAPHATSPSPIQPLQPQPPPTTHLSKDYPEPHCSDSSGGYDSALQQIPLSSAEQLVELPHMQEGGTGQQSSDSSTRHGSVVKQNPIVPAKPLIEELSHSEEGNPVLHSRMVSPRKTSVAPSVLRGGPESGEGAGTRQSDSDSNQTEARHSDSSSSQDSSDKSPLQQAFEELCDPLLPVRGHALMTLAHLLQVRDDETLASKQVLLTVFQENLRHGDSYLYLAAIKGLSALADCFPQFVLPALAQEFAGFSSRAASVGVTAEHRLKLGEALMKATRNLGEMIPQYRDMLLATVLTGARDGDSTVRASSMSNLAEICSLLHFSLGSVMQEVLHCCTRLLETDEAIVRRAAALTLAKILEGLGQDSFTVLEEVLPSLYRLLKRVVGQDKDEAVVLHARLALDHLHASTTTFAFPPQTLRKHIQVLPDANTFR